MSIDPRKDLPGVNSPQFLEKVREAVQTYLGNRGNALDRGLTLRDMVDVGILAMRPGYTGSGNPIGGPGPNAGGGGGTYEADLTPPPTPTGFNAQSAITHVLITHDDPTFQMGHGYLRTNVYGVTRAPGQPVPTFANAVPVTQFTGTIFGMASNPATTWHLWIKWETNDNVESVAPAGGINGFVIRTGEDVTLLLEALKGKITESQLYSDLGARIDLIDGTGPGSFTARVSSVTQLLNGVGNQAVNSEFATGLEQWTYSGGTNCRMGRNISVEWILAPGTAFIEEVGTTGPVYTEARPLAFGVAPGARYEWSIYTGAHRCKVDAFIYWLDSQDVIVGNSPLASNNEEQAGGTTLAGYKRLVSFGVAPANATKAWGMIRKNRTRAGQTSSYAFFTRAFFGPATADQTIPSPYTPTSNQRGLMGQYTFKLDLNGYITGYGLSSTVNNGKPESAFAVRADMFYVASPAGPGINPVTPFSVVTVPTVINGVAVPVGVYMDGVYIKHGTFDGAKIARLTVDDGAIVNLNVSKLTAGSLRIGSYISSSNYVDNVSGFAIWADGNARFNNVIMRGGVYASFGSFTGDVYANNGWFRGAVNTGSYYGYAWPTDGGGGAHMSANGILVGNAALGKYFQLTSDGNLYAPQFYIVNGVANFLGSLNVRSAAGGARTEMRNDVIKVFDANGTLRVQIGNLDA